MIINLYEVMSIKKIPFSPPDITESEVNLVSEALRSGWITTGPKTKEFERLIALCCQTEQAVCLNSATACMELILRVLGVGQGDEVITPAYTYTATASVTCHVGAKVVMVDTAPDSFEMDYDKLADAITERTKVVLPVDLAGVVCDYDKIFAAVESKNICFRQRTISRRRTVGLSYLRMPLMLLVPNGMERCVVRSLILLRFPSMP